MVKDIYSKKQGLKAIAKQLLNSGDFKIKDPKILLTKSYVCECYGILGFPKFTDGYYIYFMTKKKLIGYLLGSEVYEVKRARLEMILNEVKNILWVGKQRPLPKREGKRKGDQVSQHLQPDKC